MRIEEQPKCPQALIQYFHSPTPLLHMSHSPENLPSVPLEVVSWDPPLPTVEEFSPPASGDGDGDDIQLTPSITLPVNQKNIKVRVCHVTSPASIFVQILQYDGQLKRYGARLGNPMLLCMILLRFETLNGNPQ